MIRNNSRFYAISYARVKLHSAQVIDAQGITRSSAYNTHYVKLSAVRIAQS